MPPDSGNSGLAALVPALSKSPGLIGMAGDLMGMKSNGAVFAKVLESRTVQDHLIERFDLRKKYRTDLWEDTQKEADFAHRCGRRQEERRYFHLSA